MKHSKKYLVMGIAAVLSLSLFSGCSSFADSENTGDEQADTAGEEV